MSCDGRRAGGLIYSIYFLSQWPRPTSQKQNQAHISEQEGDVVHGVGGVGEEIVDPDEVGLLAHAGVVLVPDKKCENWIQRDDEDHLENLQAH